MRWTPIKAKNRSLPQCLTGGGGGKLVAHFEMYIGSTHPDTSEEDIRGFVKENKVISFLSYKTTLDTVKTKWISDLANLTNISFINIQEHFCKSKTIGKFFSEEFPMFNSYMYT